MTVYSLPHRGFVLTGKARAALDADQRLIPADIFDQRQYDAIRNAGYVVQFVPLASVLEALT